MNRTVKITESQLNNIVRKIISEDAIIPLSLQTDINSKNVNTASWERIKGRNIPITIGASGSNVFKLGKDQIDKSNQKIKDIVTLLTKIQSSGGGTVTVNGKSSNTDWGSYPASSSQAKKNNTELAKRRRDNMISFLKGLGLSNLKFVSGNYTVGDSDKEENQNVTLDIVGAGSLFVDPKGDIGDNTRTSPKIYDKNFPEREDIYPIPVKTSQSRVCTKVPTKHVSELKKVIYNWGKTKGLKLPMSDKIIK
jgi:hypothetical protein